MLTYLYDIIQNMLGQYQPVLVTQNGNTFCEPDYTYITACIVFCICVWSIFRIIGGIICSKL